LSPQLAIILAISLLIKRVSEFKNCFFVVFFSSTEQLECFEKYDEILVESNRRCDLWECLLQKIFCQNKFANTFLIWLKNGKYRLYEGVSGLSNIFVIYCSLTNTPKQNETAFL